MSAPAALVLIANARLPSVRAQSLQVVHAAASFARAGVATTLLHARRHPTPALPPGVDLFEHTGVPPGPRPDVEALDCVDWIDRAPRALQYLPARIQELSFARSAARRAAQERPGAVVLSREIEAARQLVRAGRRDVFLEVHRVPGGRLRRRWLLEAAAGCRGVLAISGGVEADLVELGVARAAIRVEHDALEPTLVASALSRAEARRELGIEGADPLVVYTGGLLAWKGVDLLADAARLLPGVRFVVAGGSEADVAELRARTAFLENLRVDGFQPPARIGLYLAAADAGVVPNRSRPAISARYTSPLKVFEAMGAGLPLVASDLPSLRELLRDGEDAVLVAPDDSTALAHGIERLLGDRVLRERIARNLRARSGEHTWDARAARVLAWVGERAGAVPGEVQVRSAAGRGGPGGR